MPYAKEQKWKCNICKGEIIIDKDGEGDLVCCGQKMELITQEIEPPKVGEEKEEPAEPPKPPKSLHKAYKLKACINIHEKKREQKV